MRLLTTDPTTLNILLAIPSAIIAIGSILNFLYSLLKPKEPKPQSQPTPPGYYRNRIIRLIIYIFSLDDWTEPAILHKYLTGEDRDVREGFRKALRGLYQLTESEEEGRIGPLVDGPETAATEVYTRRLFKGPLGPPSARAGEPTPVP